ncbi:hypothetical protein V9K67_18705 [Paraflavisolibacter sp. H34]|uniref:hypothetical protein n=1 Tax=Huijunlia imazamoxiresistens TaxID=3127457 RepID=UPI003015BFF3
MKKLSILFGGLITVTTVLVSWNTKNVSVTGDAKPILHQKAGNSHINGGGTTLEPGPDGDERSTFVFNAVKLPNGTVKGQLHYKYRAFDLEWKADITCFTIRGNEATLSGTITSFKGDPALAGNHVVGAPINFLVQDNGQGAGQDLVSDFLFVPLEDRDIQCTYDGTNGQNVNHPYLPVYGNITIKP